MPLIVGISLLCILGWFVNTFRPTSPLLFLIFFTIVAATTFTLSLFMIKIVRRALLVTLGVVIWLLLRLLGLRDFYYPLLLVPLLISLEILFQKR